MPMLNVSPALTNPYTLDTFNVIRRAEQVSNTGRSSAISVQISNVRGVVSPGSDEKLEKPDSADYTAQDKTLTIKSRFFLRGASLDGVPQSYQPDLVVWHGNNFIVKTVFDWSAFASGFVKAICEVYDLVPQPPTATVNAPISPNFQMQLIQLTPITPGGSSFTLSYVPASPSGVPVWYDGVLQKWQTNYLISGNVLTLNFTLESGASVAVFM